MAGISKPSVAGLGPEVTPVSISGTGSYGTTAANLFNGSASGGGNHGVFEWAYAADAVYLTIDRPVNIWRTISSSYPGYSGTLTASKKIDEVWVNVTSSLSQVVTNLAYGQWEKTFSGLTAGEYKFTVGSSTRLDGEWYLELANHAPDISNFFLDLTSTHVDKITATFDLFDVEGDAIEYRILLNGIETQGWVSYPSGTISETFLANSLSFGSNTVRVEGRNSNGASSYQELFVTRVNNPPFKMIGYLAGNSLTASLGDADNDRISYRVKFNEDYLTDWSPYASAPVAIKYEVNRTLINFGVTNTLVVEYKDELGVSGPDYIEEFVGDYYGLLFSDANGEYFSSDMSVILKKLDFGIVIATQTSMSKEVIILNKCGYGITNLNISAAVKKINRNVSIELSKIEAPFTPESTLVIPTLNDGEHRTFYVRIKTELDSLLGGDFEIIAEADAI